MTDEATGQHARLETLHSCFTPLTDPTLDAFSENSKSVFYAETIRLILAPLADWKIPTGFSFRRHDPYGGNDLFG